MSCDRWCAGVKREVVALGLSVLDAANALDDKQWWFEGQFEAGSFSGITASEWVSHYRVD